MTLILDYSFARPNPAAMKAAGYSGVMRYLSYDSTKNLSKTEAIGLHAAGLDIGLVWETTATRAGEGSIAGAVDAIAAEAQATALGYPADAVIFYGVDYDAAPQAVAPYFAGVKSKARRPVGVYGSKRVVEGVAAPYKWQACAWSAGLVSTQAHLYQRLYATVAHPVSGTDENVVLRAFPMWRATDVIPAVFVTPTPTPEVDMPITQTDADLIVHTLLVTKLGSSGPNIAVALQTASGVNAAAVAAAVLAAIPAGSANFTLEELAKAINDDAAKRLAS